MRREAQLLLHHSDAERVRLLRRQSGDRSPVHQDLAAVGPQRARQEVDQRALARAVLAEQSVDAAADELDRDLAEHGIAEERLRDIPRSQDRLLHAHSPRKGMAGGYFFRLLAISSSNSFVS